MHNNRHNRKTGIIPQTIIVPTKSIIVASLVCVCVCVIIMFSTCWAVWQFDPLTRASQLSPVSPDLSIDQQSLRHETATGNLSGGETLTSQPPRLQHSCSFIRETVLLYSAEQALHRWTHHEMLADDYTISVSMSIWKCLQLYYCRSQ